MGVLAADEDADSTHGGAGGRVVSEYLAASDGDGGRVRFGGCGGLGEYLGCGGGGHGSGVPVGGGYESRGEMTRDLGFGFWYGFESEIAQSI